MGQQRAASGTWRSHNKPTSRGSYETMGQQTCPSNMSHPAIEPDRVKKSKSRFEAERKIPSESEGKSSDFARYGMVVKKYLCQLLGGDFRKAQVLRALDMQLCKFVITACVEDDRVRLGSHFDKLFLGHPSLITEPPNLGGLGKKMVIVYERVRDAIGLGMTE